MVSLSGTFHLLFFFCLLLFFFPIAFVIPIGIPKIQDLGPSHASSRDINHSFFGELQIYKIPHQDSQGPEYFFPLPHLLYPTVSRGSSSCIDQNTTTLCTQFELRETKTNFPRETVATNNSIDTEQSQQPSTADSVTSQSSLHTQGSNVSKRKRTPSITSQTLPGASGTIKAGLSNGPGTSSVQKTIADFFAILEQFVSPHSYDTGWTLT